MGRFLLISATLLLAAQTYAQPHIVRKPWYESTIDSNAILLVWSTDTDLHCTVRYWEADSGSVHVAQGGSGRSHSVLLTNLQPCTTYAVQLLTDSGSSSDTVRFYTSTSARASSAGTIDAYFNRWIDTVRYPLSQHAHAGADLLAMLKQELERAKHSIDLAVYSFSGKTGNTVRSWLRAARDRGLRVRVIADSGAIGNSSAFTGLRNDGIPAITNAFGATGDSWSNIHHNKFILIDGRGDYPETAAVITGSWNLSDQQTTTDYQNVLVIHDEAVARTYEREFEEEWGSAGDQPDSTRSRFSYRKIDNTAPSFVVGGVPVRVLFSPNGGIAGALKQALDSAKLSVLFALYQFTSDSLAFAIEEASRRAIQVHGVIGAGGASDVYPDLIANGIDVVHFAGYQTLDSIFHHKYSIVDPGLADAIVTTGSYNWTVSAEARNNENEVILMSPILARDYFSEWISRYKENGGDQPITFPASARSATRKGAAVVYPDPARGPIHIQWSMTRTGKASVSITDQIGVDRYSISSVYLEGPNNLLLSPKLPSGSYTLRVQHDGHVDAVPLIIIH